MRVEIKLDLYILDLLFHIRKVMLFPIISFVMLLMSYAPYPKFVSSNKIITGTSVKLLSCASIDLVHS